ncbi:MAG: PPC domain-containing protein [Planctomycetota bacterium]|nr:PPC domain-containing protein [Planctomycetota bacterium]
MTHAAPSIRQHFRRVPVLASALALLSAFISPALAAAPSIGQPRPVGGQRGAQVVVNIGGDRLADAKDLFFYEPGIALAKIEPAEHAVNATLQIAPDCPIGEHRFRLRTGTGVSVLRTFYVGPLPVVMEAEPNSDFAKPQKIEMNVTVEGTVENEDVDYYQVEAKKGQRITAEVEGMRLGETLFDPYVAILDMKRFELAASDDTALLRQDPSASAIAPEDGSYVIMVRESAYGGSGDCRYRLHVGDLPRPTAVFPAGGKPGETLKVKYLGDKTGAIEATIKLPDQPQDYFPVFAEQNGKLAPSPNLLRVGAMPDMVEVEPNNDREHATPFPGETLAPLAFNGIIDKPGDRDWFRFKAKKGQVLDVEVYARRLRTPLDSVLTVTNASGGVLASNDDAHGSPDSGLRFTAPDDGDYCLEVRDHLDKGGPDFVYRVEITAPAPSLGLEIPDVGLYDSQNRKWIAVPKGNRAMAMMTVSRENVGGDVVISSEDLPAGVKIDVPLAKGNMGQVPVVFEAAGDAPGVGKLVDMSAKLAQKDSTLTGRYTQNVALVQGQNGILFYGTHIERLAVAVTEPAPFSLTIVQPKTPLPQSGVMPLKVVAERSSGFKGPITVEMPYRPPGLGAPPSVTIPQDQNEVVYTINANGDAATGEWPLVVAGHADAGGDLWVASPFIKVNVAPPVVTGEILMTATAQGNPADVVCKITPTAPFEGQATMTLLGLPAKCEVAPVTFTKDDKEVVFKVKVEAGAPAGQHKGLFCQLSLPRDGETMVQTLAGGGVLRIDKPKPAEVAKAPEPAPPPPPAAAAAAPVRLSRLEQLRIDQAKANKQKPGGG